MKNSKFTDQQIAFAPKQTNAGTSVEEVCRTLGVSQATFYRWTKVYGGLMPSEGPPLEAARERECPVPSAYRGFGTRQENADRGDSTQDLAPARCR